MGIVDTDKYCYLMTYSYPCTSISAAGKQEGFTEGSGTTSSMLWGIKRIFNELTSDRGGNGYRKFLLWKMSRKFTEQSSSVILKNG